MDFNSITKKYCQPLFAGALLSLAFAPVSLPGLGILSLAWLFYQLLNTQKPKKCFQLGWLYGLGFFLLGTSWIYISIHSYGRADVISSLFVTLLFCLFMGLYIALSALAFSFFTSRHDDRGLLLKNLTFSIIWIIFEYLRANLFTGFPWLLLGYSQTVTPMKYLAPIIGVYGLSFLVAFSGGLLAIAYIKAKEAKPSVWKWTCPILGLLSLYFFPEVLVFCHWTKSVGTTVPVSIIQGNIAEDEKWLPHAYEKTITRYVSLTKKLLPTTQKNRIIVWPEGAIPVPYSQATHFLKQLSAFISQHHATLVTGIPYENANNTEQYFNAMLLLGKDSGHYFKHHIVPFGEYFPAEIFRDLMKWLGVSLYETGRGAITQPLLSIAGIPTLPFICYEIAYADILLKSLQSLPTAQLFITISDDAWFGHSMARAQHLQIAQMRSLQAGRYQIFAANNGISAVINADGDVIKTVPSFEIQTLNSAIQAMSGSTPWAKVGDDVILGGLVLFWVVVQVVFYCRSRRRKL